MADKEVLEEKEEQEEDVTKPATWKNGFKRLFNYGWVAKNMYYFLFLGILALLYIYNGHYAENTIKDINRTSRQLKELQYEYKTVKGELMMRGKQSELAAAVEKLGLRPLQQPPVKIGTKK